MVEAPSPTEAHKSGRIGSPERMRHVQEILSRAHSTIIDIPYSSRISGMGKGNKPLPDSQPNLNISEDKRTTPESPHRRAKVLLSSYSTLVTAATGMLYDMNVADNIVAIGENTFGIEDKDTATLQKEYLQEHNGIPEDNILVFSGKQDTNEQVRTLSALKEQNPALMEDALYVVMDFHKDRVAKILRDNQLPGDLISAEDVILERFRRQNEGVLDPQEYTQRFDSLRQHLEDFTSGKVKAAEKVFKVLSYLGKTGELGLRAVRKLRGGTTVTDHANLTSGVKQREAAQKAVDAGLLKEGDITKTTPDEPQNS